MIKRIILAIVSGALLALAFPPFDMGFIAWFGYVPFLYALDDKDGGRLKGLITGFVFGLSFFLGTVYWVIHSMYYYGGVPYTTSALVMLLLVVYLSVYPAVFGLVFSLTARQDKVLRLIALPALWVALEYGRGYIFTGLPWVLTGYTQASYIPVVQIADTTGVWGVSFLILIVNVAVFYNIEYLLKKTRSLPFKESAIALALLVSVVSYGVMRVRQVDNEVRLWNTMRVGIAQGSIDQSLKWDPFYQRATLDIYRALSLSAGKMGASLIVWPEAAIPFYFEPDKVRDGLIGDITRETGSFILTGSPSYSYNPTTDRIDYFNSAFLLSPKGESIGKYDKVHLVPFGEYVPLKKFLPFVKKLTAGIGDFSVGPGPVPIDFEGGSIGTLVCFESIFPELSAGSVRNGATLLVNITNDAWFGTTSAPYQHFQMSIFRAVENKVFVLRSANTGISGVIDPVGRVRQKTGLFKRDIIVDTIGLKRSLPTFYTERGDVFAFGCLGMAALFIISAATTRRK
ncbi:MAG: apolipoprotein N-acyltransferase [Deltaproteobacteria bacterium GWC2_56_8]|nr:MAG: apolipoprotein N-acyltransferase [Deltaproteobacteria bacterium GWB2_55_19]OGP35451.1 MAG: apolipoprotein N-acyltransferase [Deltaproteobacteria bacterium GWC2_56_8]